MQGWEGEKRGGRRQGKGGDGGRGEKRGGRRMDGNSKRPNSTWEIEIWRKKMDTVGIRLVNETRT